MKIKIILIKFLLKILYYNFCLFFFLNISLIKKKKIILFYITKRKFVGSGFGHNAIILAILRNRKINFNDILIIDFTRKISHNKYNMFNVFGVSSLYFNIWSKKINKLLATKHKNKFIKYILPLFSGLKVKVIESLDNFYFDNKKKSLFFDNRNFFSDLNSNSDHFSLKRRYILEVSRANADIQEAVTLDNIRFNQYLTIKKDLLYLLDKKLKIKIKNNLKNILLYRRFKNNDYKCGSYKIEYYLELIKLIDSNCYNIFCVGDFSMHEKALLVGAGAYTNLEKTDEAYFYVWSCINADICLLECGGGMSLPLVIGKKSVIFNSVSICHLIPNSIVIPKTYTLGKKKLSFDQIILRCAGPNIPDDVKLELVDARIIKKELDFLISNEIKDYKYEKTELNNNKYLMYFKTYNHFISNSWINSNL